MSEYLEAISRLNAPERNPGISISRSLFPIPRRDTPINMNRIMAETLNTPTNKYSIPQTLNIMYCPNERYFTFPLDKHFILAKGGRKSIGIRSLHFYNDWNSIVNQLNGLKVRYNVEVTLLCEGMTEIEKDNYLSTHPNLNNIDWPNLIIGLGGLVDEKIAFIFNGNADIECNYDEFQASILAEVFNLLDADANFNNHVEIIHDDVIGSIKINDVFDDFVLFNSQSFVLVNVSITDIGTYTGQQHVWTPKSDTFIDFYYGNHNFNTNTLLLESPALFKPPDIPELVDVAHVCSSINPWSPKCIIGPLSRTHDVINRVFPYDNQQEIKIWFVDARGRVLPNYDSIFDGYMELELIIDNENNFAIDQD